MSSHSASTLNTPYSMDEFPYTERYVRELLQLDESQLNDLSGQLGLAQHEDPYTGAKVYTHQEMELLRHANELSKTGQSVGTLQPQQPSQGASPSPQAYALETNPAQTLPQTRPDSQELAQLVDAISASKETILSEISSLLDDRLSGLDEVVIELIRSKSENDSLRQRLSEAIEAKERLERELNRFKPVQFGFYKKVNH